MLPPSFGSPSAPTLEETDHENNIEGRPRQVQFKPTERLDYLPSRGSKPLYMSLSPCDVFISKDCEMKIKETNARTLTLCCLKNHSCAESSKSLKVMYREIGSKPSEPSVSFHLKMLHEDPSNINTIRQFLDLLKESYLKKFGLKKVVLAADGKIYALLIRLMTEYEDDYSFVIPYLGEKCFFPKVSIRHKPPKVLIEAWKQKALILISLVFDIFLN